MTRPQHQFTVKISRGEIDGLKKLAELQRRDFRDQAAILIREGLIRYGIITWDPTGVVKPVAMFSLGERRDPEDLENDSQLLQNG